MHRSSLASPLERDAVADADHRLNLVGIEALECLVCAGYDLLASDVARCGAEGFVLEAL